MTIAVHDEAGRVIESCTFMAGLALQPREIVLAKMVAALGASLPGIPEAEVLQSVLERENVRPTGTTEGVAFPHGKHADIDGVYTVVATIRGEEGIDFGSCKPLRCRIIVLTVSSSYRADGHLQFLAYMARCLRHPTIRASVISAQNKAAFLDALHAGCHGP